MATKKKISKKADWLDDQVDELNDAFADKVFEDKTPARKKASKVKDSMIDPIVVKGSHLTVTTWADGRTKLEWDDDALLRDVQAAVLKHESNIPASKTNTKKAPAKKTAAKKPVAKKTVKKTKK